MLRQEYNMKPNTVLTSRDRIRSTINCLNETNICNIYAPKYNSSRLNIVVNGPAGDAKTQKKKTKKEKI